MVAIKINNNHKFWRFYINFCCQTSSNKPFAVVFICFINFSRTIIIKIVRWWYRFKLAVLPTIWNRYVDLDLNYINYNYYVLWYSTVHFCNKLQLGTTFLKLSKVGNTDFCWYQTCDSYLQVENWCCFTFFSTLSCFLHFL